MPKRKSNADSHFDTLFGAKQGEQLASGFKLIPRDKIERNGQPRQSFPKEEITELANSITALRERGEGIEGTGILQPLLVTQSGDSYCLIAGERRYRASEQAGVDQLPAILIEANGGGVLLAQLVENLQRRDLPPLEEARGLEQLITEQKLSLREAARVLGKGKGYLENRLNLLKMGEDVQKMVSVQTDTLLHARDIDAVRDSSLRTELIHAVLDEGISRAELRRRIEGDSPTKSETDKSSQLSVQTDSKTSGKEINTGNESGRGDTTSTNTDPLISSLRPAVAFTAEFARKIQTLRMTRDYQNAVTRELEQLKQEVANIEKQLKEPKIKT